MLFFFELFLFVLVMLTLALGEFVSRGLALTLWLVVTAFTLAGYVLARQSLRSIAAGQPGIPGSPLAASPPAPEPPAVVPPTEAEAKAEAEPGPDVPTPLDEKWARTLLYNWRRANVLLILGALVVGGWYWLGLRV